MRARGIVHADAKASRYVVAILIFMPSFAISLYGTLMVVDAKCTVTIRNIGFKPWRALLMLFIFNIVWLMELESEANMNGDEIVHEHPNNGYLQGNMSQILNNASCIHYYFEN